MLGEREGIKPSAPRAGVTPQHPLLTHLWTQSVCGPSRMEGSLQNCPRCPLQAQALVSWGLPIATSCPQGENLVGPTAGSPRGSAHGNPWVPSWVGVRCSLSPSEPAFLISLSLLCKGEKSGKGGARQCPQRQWVQMAECCCQALMWLQGMGACQARRNRLTDTMQGLGIHPLQGVR